MPRAIIGQGTTTGTRLANTFVVVCSPKMFMKSRSESDRIRANVPMISITKKRGAIQISGPMKCLR